MSAAREVILGAKKLLEKHGWCQLIAINPKGNICLTQALGRANNFEKGSFEVFLTAEQTIEKIVCQPIVRWNDTAGRTVEEVFDVLDKAAKEI